MPSLTRLLRLQRPNRFQNEHHVIFGKELVMGFNCREDKGSGIFSVVDIRRKDRNGAEETGRDFFFFLFFLL